MTAPQSSTTLPDDLRGILAPGEAVLWQGRPDTGAFVTLSQLLRLVRIVVMIGLFFYILGRVQKTIPPLWDVRVIVLAIFLQAVPSEIIRSVLRRRRTRYALTPTRAVIVTDQAIFGTRVQSIPLTPTTVIELQQGRTVLSILFPNAPKRGWSLLGEIPKPGFERLQDGHKVMAMIRQIQTAPPSGNTLSNESQA